MVITFEGYNGKKNKSVRTASEFASFSAIKNGDKTLVINLINPDIDTAERMLAGVGMGEELKSTHKNNISDDGIDSLLRQAETRMLTKEDIDNYVLHMLHIENRLDVASVTKNKSFNDLLLSDNRFMALKRVILSTKEVYDNIILILDSKEKEVNDKIKALDEIDVCVYCLKQGFQKHEDAVGKKIVYVVTEYDSKSKFSLKSVQREFTSGGLFTKSDPILKIAANVYAQDAAISGDIIQFVGRNKEPNTEDVNYEWINDEITLMNLILNDKKVEKKEEHYEKIPQTKRTFKSFNETNNKNTVAVPAEEIAVTIDQEYVQPPLNIPAQKEKHGLFKRKNVSVSEEEIESAPVEEAPKKSPKPITVNGVTYTSLKAACDAYDLDYSEVKNELRAGSTVRAAFRLD